MKKEVIFKVKKRNGSIVSFEKEKISDAILKAFDSVNKELEEMEQENLINSIVDLIIQKNKGSAIPNVELIQDCVEEALISQNYSDVAKSYILYRNERKKNREKKDVTIEVGKTYNEYLGKMDWRVNANSNQGFSVGGLILNSAGKITANYWLEHIYPKKIGEAHRNGDFHIHDLDMFAGYCAGWSIRQFLEEGYNGVPDKLECSPPNHLSTALSQLVNALGTLQNEFAGAQALGSFDTFLSPFVHKYSKELKEKVEKYGIKFENKSDLDKYIDEETYKYVHQEIQSFIFNMNVPSRWGSQTPFSNITLDITPPSDLKDKSLFLGGISKGSYEKKYGELQKEMNMINKALVEVYIAGDSKGKVFTFPIPTYNITEDINWDNPIIDKIFEMTAKYGIPYFQNFVGSQYIKKDGKFLKDKDGNKVKNEKAYSVGDVRSMCCFDETAKIKIFDLKNETNKVITIKSFVEKYNKNKEEIGKRITENQWKIKSVNPKTLEEGIVNIVGILQKKYNGKMLNFSSGGKEINVTEDHVILVKNKFNGLIEEIEAKEILKDKDKYLLMIQYFSENKMENNDIKNEEKKIEFKKIDHIKITNVSNKNVYDIELEKNHYFNSNGIISSNCRLQLDLNELKKRGGGLFGSAEMTGSIGVVTINAARLGYNYKGDKEGYKTRLLELMEIAKESLEIKRKTITLWMDRGLYPFTKRYLGNFRNHFSTIGILGMNESILNFTNGKEDITTPFGQNFAIEIMDYMRKEVIRIQEETGKLYNIEASPGEGTTYRFAKEDKKQLPGIIQAGTDEFPYYTNSTQIPVEYTDDIFEALDLQDELQCKYTGGTVFHMYVGEKIESQGAKLLVKKALGNYRLPYITLSPVFSICPKHGYIAGEHDFCPKCDREIGYVPGNGMEDELEIRKKHTSEKRKISK